MASTQYNTYVCLFKAVPFTGNYNNTLCAASRTNKFNWLKANYDFDEYRDLMTIKLDTSVNRGVLHLTAKESAAYDYNYGYVIDKGRTYFIFIDGCRYINDAAPETTGEAYSTYDFTFSKDLLMTYLTSQSVFVNCPMERTHISTEEDRTPTTLHRIPENIPYGEYVANSYLKLQWFEGDEVDKAYVAVLEYTADDGITNWSWNATTMIPAAVSYQVFRMDYGSAQTDIDTFIKTLQSPEQVIGLYTLPSPMVEFNNIPAGGCPLAQVCHRNNFSKKHHFSWGKSTSTTFSAPFARLDGYAPKNNKLYYYPYVFARLYNDVGNSVDLLFENWGKPDDIGYDIEVQASPVQPVVMKAGALNYNGQYLANDTETICIDKRLTINDYPLGSWNCDAYQIFQGTYRNHALDIGTAGLKSAVQSGVANFSKDANTGASTFSSGPITSMLTSEISYVRDKMDAYTQADSTGGATASSNVEYINNGKSFAIATMSIRNEFAKRIDNYFTRYGYAMNGVCRTPNTKIRQFYTYMKVSGTAFKPTMSESATNNNETVAINDILRSGVTFWNIDNVTKSNIFDYENLNNV